MSMENMIEKAKENKMTIFGVLGAIAAAFLGKKFVDKRRGSSAYRFQLPMDGSKMPEEEAFFAFKQREGYAPGSANPMNRMEWMNEYSEGGYVKGAHGRNAYAQDEWASWSEKLISNDDEGQWSEVSSGDSQLFGGAFGGSISEADEGSWGGSSTTDNFSADFYPEVPKF